ncbi:hypothetical protein CO057_02180 [Candidatus Uhrbacteria bacterium CG_4_9_14_0_2_um_filter_41_50]|uniref:Transcription regulator TrmB N-terminal domain-containing protein n=1 Tax=Candidatus Uhrbacteria bacterium CG_4_9_14_0_2_um_filter_41_50 TaxID=1975031 RepID=A0A2M8EP82_9BACT|nr:MAG: hypothetical protein COZ45_02150 [Candidatus Uhrbacteria bacterium CG_4_10_14_3_um_filter_41_21]PIZ54778.1 MAG: hypothetical protein COY24_02545 [Candidatus Uhrbacteria bacterium CG_4_10_14_0_2_um_filter_41_21]PJB84905.1 MAG: hypothetical protein CO086_01050 [Candidatus Uhrbacteria bacterium CG_4_9_14_0_8_um_filter_41_16]PJC24553.1 MAG: hypothetical protein CO057_02180 [Candidatus Uhrbacteria bacterium CG_4_9_14_0_2_um_filter_41_50]PJE75202.1 MAG: hypothetical protein COV03_01335 [Candi
MIDLVHDLASLGFSKKESAIYISALEQGIASAYQIGKRAGVNRATTYSILQSLTAKGLITPLLENGESRFRAETPQRILTLLHLQQKEIEQKRLLADEIVLRLSVFHNIASNKPVIKYFESYGGIKSLQKEYELLDSDMIQIVGLDTLKALRGTGTNVEHIKELEFRSSKIRAIVVTDDPDSVPEFDNVECVIIPTDLIDVKGEMTVCGDRLLLFSYTSGLIAVEIHSKTIADTARATLELAWQRAKDWANQQTKTTA